MPAFTIVWLERTSGVRRSASCEDEKSARDLAGQLKADGHDDVRYKGTGDQRWRAVRSPKKPKPEHGVIPTAPLRPKKTETQKQRMRSRRGKWDVLDIRLPGSFESGKDR